LTVLAGTRLMDLVRATVSQGLQGIESMAGIPGTVGGALRMNAGAFGQEIETVTESVSGFKRNGKPFQLLREHIQFGYRTAPELTDMVITSATLRMRIASAKALKVRMEDILARRAVRQPLEYPSCGSVFKRPPGDYAGRLIDAAGLKGTRIGDAMVSPKHAGFIVNLGTATAADIHQLMCTVQSIVAERFGIQLEPEVKLVGPFNPTG
jgi:UDP-N-acetylmuramate dehydrogenase